MARSFSVLKSAWRCLFPSVNRLGVVFFHVVFSSLPSLKTVGDGLALAGVPLFRESHSAEQMVSGKEDTVHKYDVGRKTMTMLDKVKM